MTPEFRVKPASNAPAEMDHVYGCVPPAAVQVAVNGAIDAGPAAGVHDMVSGAGLLAIVNVEAVEATLPGFTTVTDAEPAEATRAAGTVAVSWPALTHVVASAVPFHWTTAPGMS